MKRNIIFIKSDRLISKTQSNNHKKKPIKKKIFWRKKNRSPIRITVFYQILANQAEPFYEKKNKLEDTKLNEIFFFFFKIKKKFEI